MTQKICKLLAYGKSKPAEGQEKQWVSLQIEDKVLSNWEAQDQPEHLITVKTRILSGQTQPHKLLVLYREILTEGEIEYDGDPLQEELILSGIVVRQWDRLIVGNTIYSSVFNLQWVARELSQIKSQETVK